MAKEALVLEAHRGAALAVAFTSDEKELYTAGQDGVVRTWRLSASGAKKPARELSGHSGPVACLHFDPAGGRFATGSESEVLLWSLPGKSGKGGGECLAKLDGEARVAFGPGGHHLATLASPSAAPAPAAPGEPTPGARVTLWDAHELTCIRHVKPVDRRHTAIAFAPNGSLLFVGGTGPIHRIALPDGTSEGVQKGHQIAVSHIVPSPNEAVIASTGMDGTLYFWTVVGGDEVHSLSLGASPGPGGFPLSFGPDGRTIAVGCGSCTRLYSAPDGTPRRELALPADVRDVAVSPTGRWLANALGDGTVHLHEL